MTTTTRSQELFDRASNYLPGGVGSGTRSPRSGWLPLPVFAREGSGAWFVDEDGNRYIDYVMGQGPLILGHRPQAVIDAVTTTLTERGSLFSLAHDLEGEAARTVCERLPSVDLVRFSSSGTEAAMYALRFARAFTGRRADRALRGPLPRLVGCDPLVAHIPPPRPGASPMRPRYCPGRRAFRTPSGKRCWSPDGTTPRHSKHCSQRHGEQIAAVITEPILGNCGAIMPAPGLPRADARADHRGGQPADLRRGADGLSRRPRRRPGAARDRSRPDRAGQGAGGRVPGGRARRPQPR